MRDGRAPERGLTTALHYALVTLLVSLLATGLLVGFSHTVENQHQEAARERMTVLGNQLAEEISSTDHLVRVADGTGSISRTAPLPQWILGEGYTVSVETPGDGTRPELVLRSRSLDVTVVVELRTRTPVAATTVAGGPVTIEYTGAELVIERG